MSENLISTLPDTPAKAAVIARSKQLTDFKWTPLKEVPTYLRNVGNTVLPAGVEVSGFPRCYQYILTGMAVQEKSVNNL